MEAAMTDYDCRTIEDGLAALEARLAQTDDALTGQYAGLSEKLSELTTQYNLDIHFLGSRMNNMEEIVARIIDQDEPMNRITDLSRSINRLRSEMLELRMKMDAQRVMIRKLQEVENGSANS